MGDICRLCCSTKFVNHNIFDANNTLYLKMSLYLPIKVLKNDRLPQKMCDSCYYKIEDFYHFYNQTIEVQHRLRLVYTKVLPLDDSVDLTVMKPTSQSPPPASTLHKNRSTQTDSVSEHTFKGNESTKSIKAIKNEPHSPPASPVKSESEFETDYMVNDMHSDNSEDTLLINLKQPKKYKKSNTDFKNGEVKENKRGKKVKNKDGNWSNLPKNLLGDNILLNESCSGMGLETVKEEVPEEVQGLGAALGELHGVKEEACDSDVHYCCMCFTQCDSKSDMLQHYKMHSSKAKSEKPPGAPPLPDARPPRCVRCQKAVEAGDWAAHWRRHWERDRRPLRCALCEKTFRDPPQILKHGLTHKAGEAGGPAAALAKRFVCDLCPEGFVYMKCLLAHRARAHPEALGRALALRCGTCARQFAHLNSLRRHLRAHSGERNFLCSVCGKALSSREHLKFHLRIHTGYKPHVCKTCGKGFVKKCNLTLHERVHSGEKPHVCAHCGKAFSQRSTLVIHERYHSGARPYSCALCGRGFVAKGLLSMHLKSTCVDGPRPRALAE